ncbi:MAG: glycosyltransferase family 39 protein [Lentisphaeria bacterium]|nr:glycosyltransferase family 39 protein [Lentisphaeria bacterium]
MAIFEEKQPSVRWIVLLIAAVFLVSFPLVQIGMNELYSTEGEYAAAALEFSGANTLVTVHGTLPDSVFPLYPALVRLLLNCGLPLEFSLRFMSLLPLALLALLTGLICGRSTDRQAGAAAATVVLTTILSGSKAPEGYPQLLSVLIVYGGWMLWFYLGFIRSNWNAAWLSVGVFGGLAFYSNGLTAVVYFLVPLAFQQRPFRVWSKLNKPGLLAAFLLGTVFFFAWLTPIQNFLAANPEAPHEAAAFRILTYFKDIAVRPFDAFFRFFPWSLMMWAPFCPALIAIERNPLLIKYHRILFVVLGLMIWFNPQTKSRDFFYLLPLVSVLAACNYWILVRRYAGKFFGIFLILAFFALAAGAAAAAYLVLPQEVFAKFAIGIRLPKAKPAVTLLMAAEVVLSFAASAAVLLLIRGRRPVWLTYLFVFASFMLLFWAVVNPVRSMNRGKTELADGILKKLREDAVPAGTEPETVPATAQLPATLYKDPAIMGLYSEGCYIGIPIRTLAHDKIPAGVDPAYVLTADVPSHHARTWTRLYDREYRGKHLYIYKGVLKKELSDDDDYDYE